MDNEKLVRKLEYVISQIEDEIDNCDDSNLLKILEKSKAECTSGLKSLKEYVSKYYNYECDNIDDEDD